VFRIGREYRLYAPAERNIRKIIPKPIRSDRTNVKEQ